MQGQKGASLETTRRIWRNMARKLAEFRAIVEVKRQKPGYDERACRTAELVRGYESELAPGSPPPVGVLKGLWKQVCDEYHANPPRPPKPRKNKAETPPAGLTLAPREA
jgi:hypothetical protein